MTAANFEICIKLELIADFSNWRNIWSESFLETYGYDNEVMHFI
jgi:hypothetical protein